MRIDGVIYIWARKKEKGWIQISLKVRRSDLEKLLERVK